MMAYMSEENRATLATRAEAAAPLPTPAEGRSVAHARPVERPLSRWLSRLVMVGIVLAALNLRPAITSLGSLLEEVRDGLHMSGTVAGLLTSVPALCFAAFGVAAPRLAKRWGAGVIVCGGMAVIALGVVIRPYAGGTPGFLAASALALAGIAVSNVLMPVVIKTRFPERVGSMTGLYSMALSLGTSLAAALTVPVTAALGGGWQSGLAIWAVLAVAAALPWAVVARATGQPNRHREPAEPTERAGRTGPAERVEGERRQAPAARITTSRTAWALAVFFGLQATAAYITMGWMPQIFRDAGVSAGTAGVLLAVTMAMGVPLSFVLPRIAARMRHQGALVVVLGMSGLLGYTGLWLAPAAGAWLWVLLLGTSNCSFPLALTMIGMRARTAEGVVRLSAFAQSVGYLISIPGPLLVGVLYQVSDGWDLPIALMAGLMVPQILIGVLAGRDRRIEDEL